MTFKLATAALAITVALPSTAATIAEWNLSGAPGNQASTVGSAMANVTAAALARGPGLNAAAAGNSISSNDWDEVAPDAASDTNYFTFGFTVEAGFSVDLDALYIGTRSSGTGPGTLGLFTSVDGFTAPVFTFVQPDSTFVNSVIDLSSLPLLSGATEFRIIEIGNTQADGSGSTASAGTFRLTAFFSNGNFDRNLQFTGDVVANAVPAPSVLALLALGLPLLRRRVGG